MTASRMEKTSIIPGCSKVTDAQGNQMFDRKHRPLWNPADPIKHVTHFKNAGMRRDYENGEVTLKQATHQVPVYRGVDIETARMIRSYHRRKKSLATRPSSFLSDAKERGREGMQQVRERMLGTRKRAMAKKASEAAQKRESERKDPSTLTTEMAAQLVDEHGSVRAAANASGYSRDAISRRLARRK